MEHCNKTAFYGREFAVMSGRQSVAQNVYLAACCTTWEDRASVHERGAVRVGLHPGPKPGMRSSTVIEEMSLA